MSSAIAFKQMAAYAKRHSSLITHHTSLFTHLSSLALVAACASTPPASAPPPAPAPSVVSKAVEEPVIGGARVVTNTLNVRGAPSLEGEILTQIKKNDRLAILQSGEDWIRIRLTNGTVGWVSRALVAIDGQSAARATKRKSGCPVDSDFHFARTPTPAFSDSSRHGLVVVEAHVNTKGDVT